MILNMQKDTLKVFLIKAINNIVYYHTSLKVGLVDVPPVYPTRIAISLKYCLNRYSTPLLNNKKVKLLFKKDFFFFFFFLLFVFFLNFHQKLPAANLAFSRLAF